MVGHKLGEFAPYVSLGVNLALHHSAWFVPRGDKIADCIAGLGNHTFGTRGDRRGRVFDTQIS